MLVPRKCSSFKFENLYVGPKKCKTFDWPSFVLFTSTLFVVIYILLKSITAKCNAGTTPRCMSYSILDCPLVTPHCAVLCGVWLPAAVLLAGSPNLRSVNEHRITAEP